MEEKVKCSIRIPVSIMNSVKEESARTGKNISTCIVERLQRARKVSAPNNEKTSWIGVDQDAKKSLMFAADQAGISASDYIRRLLAPSPPVIYQITYHDLDNDTTRIDELIRTINGICKVILQSGNTYAKQVDTMIRLLRQILDEYLRIHQYERERRNELYQEAQQLIREEMKRQKRSNHGKGTDGNGSNTD